MERGEKCNAAAIASLHEHDTPERRKWLADEQRKQRSELVKQQRIWKEHLQAMADDAAANQPTDANPDASDAAPPATDAPPMATDAPPDAPAPPDATAVAPPDAAADAIAAIGARLRQVDPLLHPPPVSADAAAVATEGGAVTGQPSGEEHTGKPGSEPSDGQPGVLSKAQRRHQRRQKAKNTARSWRGV